MVDITVGTNGATLSATLTNTGNTAHDFGVTIHYYLTGNTATGSSTTAAVTNLGAGATANISWNQPKTTLSTLCRSRISPSRSIHRIIHSIRQHRRNRNSNIHLHTKQRIQRNSLDKSIRYADAYREHHGMEYEFLRRLQRNNPKQ